MAALTKAAKVARHAALWAAYDDLAVRSALVSLLADKTDCLLPLLMRLGAGVPSPAAVALLGALAADPQAGLMAQAFGAQWRTSAEGV